MVHAVLLTSAIIAFSRYKDKNLFSLSFFVLTVFAILRYGFGNDYNSYMAAYNSIRSGDHNPFETAVLFSFLNKITPSFYILVAILSIFFLYVVYKLINSKLEGVYKGFAVLVFIINPYLFLMNLSAMRQCVAMCIFIISLKYLQKREPIKYVLLILLASTFHVSAVVLLPFYFLVNDKSMDKIQTALLVVGMLMLLIEGGLITQLLEFGVRVFDNSEYTYHFLQDNSNSLRATLLTGVYFIYVAINLVHLKGYKLICGKLYLIGLFFGMLAYYFAMLTRLQMYFDIFSIVAIPAIMEYHSKNTLNRWTRTIQLYAFPIMLLVIYMARYYSFFSNSMWNSFTEYHTIFEAIL